MIPLQIQITELIEPTELTTSLALLILAILIVFAYLVIRLRHAILGIVWMSTVIVFGMVITVGLEFIWFWISVMIMAIIVGLAGVFRFFVIPAKGGST